VVGADALDRFQRGAGREDREAAGQRLLGRRHQLPAPVDDGAQRLVPGQRGPAAASQQRETVIESFGQLLRGQGAQPRRGQLDGQRHPV
jgi:hypothetical protein